MPTYRLGRFTRLRLRLSTWLRRAAARLTSPWAETSRPGITGGGSVRDHSAERSLARLAESPGVYAATMRRTMGMQRFPIVIYTADPGGRNHRPLDPAKTAWAASCLRLLQRPEAADASRPFPRMPGEYLMAMLMADYLLTGNAYVRVQRGSGNAIVGLYRLHPATVNIEVTQGGQTLYKYQPSGGPAQTFPAYDVIHIRSLPWRRDLGELLGTGAAAPLGPLVDAELYAMERTAMAIEQGGVDVQITTTSDIAAAQMADPGTRAEVVAEATEALKKRDSRVVAFGGGLRAEPMGLTPAEIKAPELMAAARASELLALGVVPVAVGDPSGATYATAAAQLRIQYGLDLEFTEVFSFWLLRPLAQAFAATDPSWADRVSSVTCCYDLASHEGALAARTEAISRMQQLVAMGWTPAQAAAIEAMDLPAPLGSPAAASPVPGAAAAPRPTPAQSGGEPSAPVGEAARSRRAWWRRDMAHAVVDAAEERALAWRAIEDGRADSDYSLAAAADLALAKDKARLMADLEQLLRGAWTGTGYDPINWDALTADPGIYTEALQPQWSATWTRAAASALPDELAGTPAWEDSDGARQLATSAEAMAETSRRQVVNVGASMVADREPPTRILDEVRDASTWGASRSDGIARTETVRAQSLGTDARYTQAQAEGVELEQEWLSARDSNVRHDHRAIDGQRVKIGAMWTFPSGISTPGPGCSGRAEEDINCRCAKRAIVLS